MITDAEARQLAKKIKAEYGLKYCTALNVIARQNGFADWQEAVVALNAQGDAHAERKAMRRIWKIKSEAKDRRRFRERLVAANRQEDGANPSPAHWLSVPSCLSALEDGDRPVDRVAARVVFQPQSD